MGSPCNPVRTVELRRHQKHLAHAAMDKPAGNSGDLLRVSPRDEDWHAVGQVARGLHGVGDSDCTAGIQATAAIRIDPDDIALERMVKRLRLLVGYHVGLGLGQICLRCGFAAASQYGVHFITITTTDSTLASGQLTQAAGMPRDYYGNPIPDNQTSLKAGIRADADDQCNFRSSK